jgi:hypothetical protein
MKYSIEGNRLRKTNTVLKLTYYLAQPCVHKYGTNWTRSLFGKMRNAHRILIGKLQVKRPHGRPGCKWEDDMKIPLKETGSESTSSRFGPSGKLFCTR